MAAVTKGSCAFPACLLTLIYLRSLKGECSLVFLPLIYRSANSSISQESVNPLQDASPRLRVRERLGSLQPWELISVVVARTKLN